MGPRSRPATTSRNGWTELLPPIGPSSLACFTDEVPSCRGACEGPGEVSATCSLLVHNASLSAPVSLDIQLPLSQIRLLLPLVRRDWRVEIRQGGDFVSTIA